MGGNKGGVILSGVSHCLLFDIEDWLGDELPQFSDVKRPTSAKTRRLQNLRYNCLWLSYEQLRHSAPVFRQEYNNVHRKHPL